MDIVSTRKEAKGNIYWPEASSETPTLDRAKNQLRRKFGLSEAHAALIVELSNYGNDGKR